MRRWTWTVACLVLLGSLACGGLPAVVGGDASLCASQPGVAPTVDLAVVDGPTPTVEAGVLVEVTSESIRIDGAAVSSPQDALSRARDRVRELRSSGVELSDALLVAVAPDVRGDRVVGALDVARAAGVTRIRFLARSSETLEPTTFVDPTYAADLASRLAEVEPAQRLTVAARELDDLLALCPSGKRVLSAVAVASPDQRCQLVIAGMEEVLPSCPLTNKEKVATAIQVAFQPPPYRLVALDLELAEDAEPFEVQPDAPWSEVAAAWVPHSGAAATWRLPGAEVAAPSPRGLGPHPAPAASPRPARVGSVSVSGGLDQAVVSRVLARSRAGMRACYEQALSRDPATSGSLEVRITVGSDGSVSSATTAADTIGDAAFSACLVSGAKRLTFPRPQGGGASIVVPLGFAPG